MALVLGMRQSLLPEVGARASVCTLPSGYLFFMFIHRVVSSVNLCLWSLPIYCWGLGGFLIDLYACN